MAQKALKGEKIGSLVKGVGGKAVPEAMNAAALFGEAGFFLRGKKPLVRRLHTDGFEAFGRQTTICRADI